MSRARSFLRITSAKGIAGFYSLPMF
jgi:hypothetical protein